MKRNLFRWFVVSFAAALLAAGAFADDSDRLVVNVPYNFVVSGQTLPAGSYRVARISTTDLHQLILTSVENHESVLAFSTGIDDARRPNPSFTFQVSGDQHFLTRIQTGDHIYTLPVSARAIQQAANSKAGSFLSDTSETTKR